MNSASPEAELRENRRRLFGYRPAEEPAVLGTADVVVIGGGLAGMSAAVHAAKKGASVVVLETRSELGGNAAMSTGYIAFAATSRQREQGIDDSPGKFVEDMQVEVAREAGRYGLFFDTDLARVYAETSAEAYDFLIGIGITFGRFIARPAQHTTTRMLALENTVDFRTCFEAALRDARVQTVFETRAKRLMTDGERVTGVRVYSKKGEGVWNARRAVILAAGGYQANHMLRQRFQPESDAFTPYYGIDTAQGDGHLMGQAVGGQLINMTLIPMYVRAPSALMEDVIAVNIEGTRFHNEPGPYLARVAALRSQSDGEGFYIFDQTTAERRALMIRHLPIQPTSADTIVGVAANIGADPAQLTTTVDEWNSMIAGGKPNDPFGRTIFPESSDGIVTPPFYSAPMIVGASFPAGGLEVSISMEVLDLDGAAIPGLFAVGDCVGGVNAAVGLGGIHLGSASTLGMIAGRTAARSPIVALASVR